MNRVNIRSKVFMLLVLIASLLILATSVRASLYLTDDELNYIE